LAEYSETWPSAGMMRNGKTYRRQPWALPIAESASGLWPTPIKIGRKLSVFSAGRLHALESARIWEPFRANDFAVRVQKLAALCRADDGLSEELGACGNAVVPQIPELIGRAILESEALTAHINRRDSMTHQFKVGDTGKDP
jgi:hypothetical protein